MILKSPTPWIYQIHLTNFSHQLNLNHLQNLVKAMSLLTQFSLNSKKIILFIRQEVGFLLKKSAYMMLKTQLKISRRHRHPESQEYMLKLHNYNLTHFCLYILNYSITV